MYKQRVKVFMAIIAAGMLILAGRVAYLQIIQGDEFRSTIEAKLRDVEFLDSLRGQILDRHGRILAIDQPCFDYCMDYRFLTADAKWVRRQQKKIARDRKISPAEATEVYRQLERNTWRLARQAGGATLEELEEAVYRIRRRVGGMHDLLGFTVKEELQSHPVVRGLDEQAAVAIKAQLSQTIGASIRPSQRRWYPYGELACHLVGLTGQVNATEQDRLNEPADAPWLYRRLRFYLPGDVIGKRGVEKLCEQRLRPRRGYRQVSKDTGEVLAIQPAEVGHDVHLTLDIELQRELRDIFTSLAGGYNGSAVVLSVPRGEVLAAASVPGFDLNSYRRDAEELFRDNVDFRLRNRALTQTYPPGSTAKPMSALAALSEGLIDSDYTTHCEGYLFPNVRDRFRCWIAGRGAHGDLSVVDAIKHSCNIFFYRLGERLERHRPGLLRQWFERFGFLDTPGTGLPGEARGVVHENIRIGEARMLAIGQGPASVTPMHVANAMATIARGGAFVSPLLVMEGGPQRVRRDLGLSPDHVELIHEGMYRVVNSRGGTAYKYFYPSGAEPLGVDVCGKSGTAQVSPQRADVDGDGVVEIVRDGNMVWFSGFAPRRDPKIAFAIVVEYVPSGAGGGSSVCGPIARKLVGLCKRLGYLK